MAECRSAVRFERASDRRGKRQGVYHGGLVKGRQLVLNSLGQALMM